MPPKKTPTKNNPAGIKAELVSSGPTVFTYVTYALAVVMFLSYGFYAFKPDTFKTLAKDYPVVEHVQTFFNFIDSVSPFNEFINDDGEIKSKETEKDEKVGERLFTKEELKTYDGSIEGKGPYLAVLGQVFDVSKGKDYYGPGGGYSFFSGIDGSRAFISGQFNDDGLTDDVDGLSNSDYLGLDDWKKFYHKDYTYVGKVIGRFYDENGQETENARNVAKWIFEAKEDKEKRNVENKMFPGCNTEWSKKTGHRVWCTKKSGGITRDWVGRPRRLFYPGRAERCACVRDSGPPSTDPSAKSDDGDLSNPHLKEYEGCNPETFECQLKPPEEEEQGKDEL